MYRDPSIRNEALDERVGNGRHCDVPLCLLAPARDKEVAKAAIQAGADAVYIGPPAFGARQAAGNSLEDLAEVVRYAHLYGVQVLVTINTLLREDEYPEAVSLAHALYKIGVDALIIQDLHLLELNLPPIRLHASTQCDNRTPEQVKRLKELGFKRVVLARELGIEEIRAIHEEVPDIELEAFVHGALCVSYSGRCYISEVLAGRSANRGACAQFCRMAYDLLDAEGNEVLDEYDEPIHQRHLLSLQDMDRSAYLNELIDAGVTTFKIEGRLKDADYVTNITAYYREKLDHLTPTLSQGEGASPLRGDGREVFITRSFTPNPEKTFHRGGIDYFLHGRTSHMANWDTPKSTGEYVGEVLQINGNTLRVQLKPGVVLHNGDGLTMGNEGFNVNGVEGNWVKVNKNLSLPFTGEELCSIGRPVVVRRTLLGLGLYRNLDVEFTKNLRSERKIPVDILFRETEDGFELQYKAFPSGRVWVGSFPYAHEPAKNADKALDTIRTQLSKLGDTPYIAREVRIESKPYFIPISVLNEWRRGVLNTEHRPFTSFSDRTQTEYVCQQSDLSVKQSVSPKDGLSAKRSVNEAVYQSEGRSLMECKYCILHEAGHCRKINPYPKDKEPRFLRLRTGKILRLTFDCKKCEMLVDNNE